MTTEDKNVRKLREKVEAALAKRKDDEAIKLLGELSEADPKAPRWPHKRGELYRKRNRNKEAIECYALAADLYLTQGFLARAVALAKTIIDIDPQRMDVLQRIDPEAARKLHREQRPASISARPMAHHPAVLPSRPPVAVPRHAAVLLEDEPEPPQHHPAVLPEFGAKAAHHPAVLPEPGAKPMRHPAVLPESDPPPAAHPAVIAEDGPAPVPRAAAPITADRSRAQAARVKRPGQTAQAEPEAVKVPGPPRVPEFPSTMLELAEELRVAPDVQPNETRFSNAPPAAGIRPSLTDRELEPREHAQARGSDRPRSPGARTLSKLPLFPLFAELPQEALVELISGAEVVDLEDGDTVVRKGDPADALYGIVEGSVDIVVPGQPTRMTLAEGDVFGESCLLAGERRHADVVVCGHLSALKISRQVFNRVLSAYPALAEVLLELLTRRLLGNLLQTSPLFQEFDARGRQELAQLFEIRRAPRGMVLAEAGKVMDGLYINLTGTLEVSYTDGRAPEQHEPGTMFGQSSLLTQDASDISVRALANMLVLRLPARAFHSMAMQYPGMLAHVSELSGSSVAKITT
jgi:CRP-like cAMP-binding protein